jgi:hypothetical protein
MLSLRREIVKRALSTTLSVLFLLSLATGGAASADAGAPALNPSTRLSNLYFRQVCAIFLTALDIYKMDAVQGMRKDAIKRGLGRSSGPDGAIFDLDRIDAKRKGWTRYYPVEIGGRSLIVRVFLTAEASYQEKLPYIEKMGFSDPAVTVEILPGINAMLGQEKIRPFNLDPVSPADRNS